MEEIHTAEVGGSSPLAPTQKSSSYGISGQRIGTRRNVLHKCSTQRNVWSMATKASGSRPGTMRERTPGHWELRVFGGYDSVTGKQIRRTKTFVGSERAAAKALGTFVQEVESLSVRLT